jgi:hypothetical protein
VLGRLREELCSHLDVGRVNLYQSLRSSLIFSSGHSGALRRLRIHIQQLGIRVDPSGCGPEGPTSCRSVFRFVRLGSVRRGLDRPFRFGFVLVCSVGLRSDRSGLAPPCSGWLAAAVTAAAAAVAAAAAAELSVLGLTWCQSAQPRPRRCGSGSVLISSILGLRSVLIGLGPPSSDQKVRLRAVPQRVSLRPIRVRSARPRPCCRSGSVLVRGEIPNRSTE